MIFVGDDAGNRKYIDDKTDVIDIDGKYVVQGIIESHNHVDASAWITYTG
ncbi:hypothetical protein GCM10027180_15570 [Microbulbifer echini]